jgi:hypothetical protein
MMVLERVTSGIWCSFRNTSRAWKWKQDSSTHWRMSKQDHRKIAESNTNVKYWCRIRRSAGLRRTKKLIHPPVLCRGSYQMFPSITVGPAGVTAISHPIVRTGRNFSAASLTIAHVSSQRGRPKPSNRTPVAEATWETTDENKKGLSHKSWGSPFTSSRAFCRRTADRRRR